MRKKKIYLALAIACLVGVIATFIFFIVRLASDEFYDNFSASSMLLTIFMYLGLVMLFVVLGVYFLFKYGTSNRRSVYEEHTKKCIACGNLIGLTELTCPRCFTLQPPGGSSPSAFRKK